jgi:hypothetical protein
MTTMNAIMTTMNAIMTTMIAIMTIQTTTTNQTMKTMTTRTILVLMKKTIKVSVLLAHREFKEYLESKVFRV